MDVTDALRKGNAALKLGETVQTSTFAVEQAMTAIEIGDERMDRPVQESQLLTSRLASGIVEQELSFAQVALFLDCLTAKLAQWWSGCSLSQTVYTSLHMLAQDRLQEQPAMAAGTALLSAIVSMSKQIIHTSSVVYVRRLPLRAA